MKNNVKKSVSSCSSQQEQSATYCADEKLYTSTFADLFPQFKDMVMTGDTKVVYQETHFKPIMLPNSVVTASVSISPTYVSNDTFVRTTRMLTGPPISNEDHYIATGGIIYSPSHFSRAYPKK
jgi:hypothetical protein